MTPETMSELLTEYLVDQQTDIKGGHIGECLSVHSQNRILFGFILNFTANAKYPSFCPRRHDRQKPLECVSSKFFFVVFFQTDRHFTLYIYLSVCLYSFARVRPSDCLKIIQSFCHWFCRYAPKNYI